MRHIFSAVLAVICCAWIGCSTISVPIPVSDGTLAKQALLDLMRADRNVFQGANPDIFEKIEIEMLAPGKYRWAAFLINTRARTYSAVVEEIDAVLQYRGEFAVTADGEWKALSPIRSRVAAAVTESR